MHSKKSKFTKIILSVTALLLISVIALGTTLSWIEGGTTLSIRTEEKGDVHTSELPQVGGTITLDPNTTKNIDLINYDETSKYYKTLDGDLKNVYFSPAASKDGKSFLLPLKDSSGNTVFRNHNTNDIGTKFISFDFKVKVTEKCYLAFASKPTISLTKNGIPVKFDDSAFRFYIKTPAADGARIFSTSTTARDVVVDTSGKVEKFSSFTAFDSFINKEDTTNNKLYSFSGDTKLEYQFSVAVWLDYTDANLDINSAIFGAEAKINLNLVVGQEKVKANFTAVTYDNGGSLSSEVGGTIDPESGWFPIGKKIKANAQNVPGYYFAGWYTDEACSQPVDNHESDDTSLEVDVPSNLSAGEEVTYYAKFVQMDEMIYFVPQSQWSSDKAWFAAYVWQSSNEANNEYFPLTDDDGDGVYQAVVPDTHDYDSIIFIRMSSSATTPSFDGKWNQTGNLTLPTDDKILFVKSNGTFDWNGNGTWYVPLTVSAVSGGNGTATANNVAHAVSYNSGKVTLNAVADEGYEFAGWYNDSEFTSTIGTSYKTANQTVTVTGSKTYYAKFTKIPVLTVNAIVSPENSGCTATVNDKDSVSVTSGTTVNLKVTEVRGYKFDGWRVGSATGSTIGGSYNSNPTTYKVEGSDGAVINLYAVFSKLPAITIKTVATPAAGGTATVNGVTELEVYKGEKVTFKAERNQSTDYVFTKWYTDPECTEEFNSAATITDYVVDGTDGEVITLYAKFVKAYKANAFAYTDGSMSVTGGTAKVTYGTTSKTTTSSINPAFVQVYDGGTVTYTAVAKSGYKFTGWYTSESATSADNSNLEFTVNNVTGELNYYARFVKDNTVYLKPNSNWTKDGARFAIYVFNNSTETNQWVSMTKSTAHSGYYEAAIPAGDWEGIIFCRMNGSASANNWNNMWNQTADLSLPSGGKNIFKIPSGAWDYSNNTNWTSSF